MSKSIKINEEKKSVTVRSPPNNSFQKVQVEHKHGIPRRKWKSVPFRNGDDIIPRHTVTRGLFIGLALPKPVGFLAKARFPSYEMNLAVFVFAAEITRRGFALSFGNGFGDCQ
ncbi:hypothetical protein JTE90_022296 [Oedothorax gibbosus]|uniref:Uncharacterized protein n=1 Tax=Oedothorax gibbosus TaxID=931172 RepID=A0AAV6VX42_9ARAC|nr:hypothetical protein JTE90_022296 [Oedothorax gibbosus]